MTVPALGVPPSPDCPCCYRSTVLPPLASLTTLTTGLCCRRQRGAEGVVCGDLLQGNGSQPGGPCCTGHAPPVQDPRHQRRRGGQGDCLRDCLRDCLACLSLLQSCANRPLSPCSTSQPSAWTKAQCWSLSLTRSRPTACGIAPAPSWMGARWVLLARSPLSASNLPSVAQDNVQQTTYMFAMRRNPAIFDPAHAWQVLEMNILNSTAVW